MSENDNKDKKQKLNNPLNKQDGNKPGNGKKRGNDWIMYIVYAIIILSLGGVWMGSGNKGGSREIGWQKLDEILRKGDQREIVVVDKEYAEIYIKEEMLKNDTAYNDIMRGAKDVKDAGHYTYKFIDVESFKNDIDKISQQNFERDTAGLADSNGYVSSERINQLQRKNHIELKSRESDKTWEKVLYWFGPILMLVFFFVIMGRITSRQMGGGGGGIFSVGKSKAKMYDGKTSTNVTFKDVAGLAGAKEEVMEVVDFLKNPKKYTALGGKIPKGVLLVGPPGTGKTLLAKAVAGEANVPFFSMSGSDFVEMFVGVGASRVRDLFEEAKKKAPCIIFIDEIDAVGRARSRGGLSNANDERENTLNQLLTEMDGFGTNNGVIVMAATNRADILDRALLRAGRFDRQIYVELPDIEERKAIFEVHMKGLKLGNDIDKDFLSKQTPGFSGADIANVCNEAALVAARKNKKLIEKQDFLDAIDRIVGGLEKRTKVITTEEKRTIAYHESGHASVSWLLRWGNPLVKVTIVPRGKALGAAWYLPEERQITTYEQMFDEITSLVAGRAAEEVVFGQISTGALNDLERATKMAFSLVAYYGMSPKVGNISYYDSTGQNDWNFTKPFSEQTNQDIDSEVKRMVEEAYQRAKDIILGSREKLDQLANLLFEREVIFREDVEQIYGPRPWSEEQKTENEDSATNPGPSDNPSPKGED
ncbi:MAG: ATP-dependent zinc metalloprotease FtsH [Bacteroidales bacterium]|nr:ATP-dependent zinc metalloprotease FtsH [Bacteroidales bacterium]